MILGIETTAHTFGIGIASSLSNDKENSKKASSLIQNNEEKADKSENIKILCNVKDVYTTEKGGIIPAEVRKHHADCAENVWKLAFEKAGVKESEISAIAVSNAPGLAPCLLEGMKFAKKKARELNIPIIPVNHCVAHLEIGRITGAKDPVLLYASGANTQIIAYASGKYRVFGETLDIGVGNFIDSFARHCGIGFPGGPKIMELAKNGKYIELPYSIKGMDVAFSGLLTNLKQKFDKGEKIEDLSYSLQETVFAMLIEAAERALAHIGKKELLLGGGVACNTRFQDMCRIMCEERGCRFFVPENSLLVDNGGMIAFLGEIIYNNIFNNSILPISTSLPPLHPDSDNINDKKIKINVNEKIIENSDNLYNISSEFSICPILKNTALINRIVHSKGKKLIYFPKDFDKLDISPRERTDMVDVKWR